MIHQLPIPTNEEYYKGYLIDIDTTPDGDLDWFISLVFHTDSDKFFITSEAHYCYDEGRYVLVFYQPDDCLTVFGYDNTEACTNMEDDEHHVSEYVKYTYSELINDDTTYGEIK